MFGEMDHSAKLDAVWWALNNLPKWSENRNLQVGRFSVAKQGEGAQLGCDYTEGGVVTISWLRTGDGSPVGSMNETALLGWVTRALEHMCVMANGKCWYFRMPSRCSAAINERSRQREAGLAALSTFIALLINGSVGGHSDSLRYRQCDPNRWLLWT